MVREAKENDLLNLLSLYQQLFPEENYNRSSEFHSTWKKIINDKKIKCFLAFSGDIAVASCLIIVIPNLTRNQRPFAVIENVITHKDYRKKGFGKAVIEKAVNFGKRQNCYKIMLLSSTNRTDAHIFYEKIGFDGNSKQGFQLRLP